MQVEALQRKAHEAEAKLKKQQAMYESVRSDRNMYSKNLVDVQEEIEVMNMTFRTLTHQVLSPRTVEFRLPIVLMLCNACRSS